MPFSPLPSGYLSLTVFCSMLLWYWVLLRTDRSRSSRRIGPRGRMRACRRRRPPPARSLRPRQSRGGRRRPPCRRGRCRGCAESRRGRPPDRRPWLWEAAKKEGRTSLKLPALPSFAQYFWALLGTPMKILTPPPSSHVRFHYKRGAPHAHLGKDWSSVAPLTAVEVLVAGPVGREQQHLLPFLVLTAPLSLGVVPVVSVGPVGPGDSGHRREEVHRWGVAVGVGAEFRAQVGHVIPGWEYY